MSILKDDPTPLVSMLIRESFWNALWVHEAPLNESRRGHNIKQRPLEKRDTVNANAINERRQNIGKPPRLNLARSDFGMHTQQLQGRRNSWWPLSTLEG